jgi:hypothetical protein
LRKIVLDNVADEISDVRRGRLAAVSHEMSGFSKQYSNRSGVRGRQCRPLPQRFTTADVLSSARDEYHSSS